LPQFLFHYYYSPPVDGIEQFFTAPALPQTLKYLAIRFRSHRNAYRKELKSGLEKPHFVSHLPERHPAF
jgi:hypothetical protein